MCGKTGSALNAKKKRRSIEKLFQTMDGRTWQGDDILKL
jgi:hypothetical protein